MNDTRIVDNLVAEAIGVFVLCFTGIMAIYNLGSAESGLIGIALAHGLAIAVMVAALGHVSGAHFNPAVTLALLLGKHIDAKSAGLYWVAQLLGGTLAAGVIAVALDSEVVAGGTPVLADGVGIGQGIVLEVVATFVLVLTVFGTAVDKRAPISVYPFAIGLSITAGILAIGPLTGAALNPARGFGPALVGGDWSGAVAWIVGPLVGGALAWLVHDLVLRPREAAEAIAEAGHQES
jgi:MIP family channel proteins